MSHTRCVHVDDASLFWETYEDPNQHWTTVTNDDFSLEKTHVKHRDL